MEKLYYKDQYTKDFIAEVLEVKQVGDKFHILLDQTAFFPGGGGQFCDLGEIDSKPVLDVYEEGSNIYHVMEKKPSKIHKVKCSIDWDRREDGMHQHFAQHVLSGCFFKEFNANTVGFHLGTDFSTVDIKGDLDEDKIRKIEVLANEVIRQNIEVEFLTPNKRELKKINLRRDLPNTDEQIRIVKIGELDINACCGVHPRSTKDLRIIKIRKWEKHKGATRIEYLAGKRAVDEVLRRDIYLTKICNYLSCGEEEALKGISNLNEKVEDALSKKRKLEEIVSNYQLKEMIEEATKIGDLSVIRKVYTDEDLKYINKVATKISQYDDAVALMALKSDGKVNLIFACSKNLKNINMSNLLKDAISLVDGRGGGSNHLAQGGGRDNGNLDSVLEYAVMKIKNIIE